MAENKEIKKKEQKDRRKKEIEIESVGKPEAKETQFTHSYVIEKPELEGVEKEVESKGKKSKTQETEIQEEHLLTDEEREDFPYIS